jgi:hypothetical protein
MGNLSTFDFTLKDDVQIVSSVRLLRQEEAQPQDDDALSRATSERRSVEWCDDAPRPVPHISGISLASAA